MHVFVNIVPQAQLDWAKLSSLIEELANQNFAATTLNLQLPTEQSLTAEQQAQAASWHLSVNDLNLPSTPHNYLLNLREADHVLPGALQQWDQLATQHPGSPISLSAFETTQDLDEQISTYLAEHDSSATQLTFQNLTSATPTTPTERQMTLWARQSYSIQTDLQSVGRLTQRIRPTGLLLPVTLLDHDLPLVSIAQAFHVLQLSQDVLRLHVPTIQRQIWAEATPVEWLDELQHIDVQSLGVMWQPAFTEYFQRQLNTLLDTAGKKNLSAANHVQLLSRIKELITPPTKVWSRLGLLRMVSPQMAHRLFY